MGSKGVRQPWMCNDAAVRRLHCSTPKRTTLLNGHCRGKLLRRWRMRPRRLPGCGCHCSSTARSTVRPTQSSPTTGSPLTRSVRQLGVSARAPWCTTLSNAPTGAAAALPRLSIF